MCTFIYKALFELFSSYLKMPLMYILGFSTSSLFMRNNAIFETDKENLVLMTEEYDAMYR